jgi:predicted MFS family arabinose efflux permease
MTTAQEYLDRRWTALILLCAAQFIVVLDASIVNVALPSIGKGLHFSEQDLPWVVNAYVITFGGFLLLGGRAADLLGRRRVFMAGLLVVAVASLAAGFAATRGQLIAARAAQGLGRRAPRRDPHRRPRLGMGAVGERPRVTDRARPYARPDSGEPV